MIVRSQALIVGHSPSYPTFSAHQNPRRTEFFKGESPLVTVDFDNPLRSLQLSIQKADLMEIERSGWNCFPVQIGEKGVLMVECKQGEQLGFFFGSLSNSPVVINICDARGKLITTSLVFPNSHLRLGVLPSDLLFNERPESVEREVMIQLLKEDGTPFSGSVEAWFTSK